MCKLLSLYYGDEGYVVRCKDCGLYQLAFMCMAITFNEEDFSAFCRIIKRKSEVGDCPDSENRKCISIPTPAEGINFLLTRSEVKRFADILEEADTEEKAQTLIDLFR